MFKRFLTFLIFLAAAGLVWNLSRHLILYFYILFPLILFPLFYFLDGKNTVFFSLCLAVIAGIYALLFLREPTREMLLFGIGQPAFFFFLLSYRRQWSRAWQEETRQCEAVRQEMETLRQKHQSRLESLHHLEKQVAGLLDLFEIARDFSEVLSFDGMADLLYKRVVPELPLEKMFLIFYQVTEEGTAGSQVFVITPEGVSPEGPGLSLYDEKLTQVKQTREIISQENRWFVPLVTDSHVSACFVVEGAHADDLAKFEVLAAYLALQVKKIRLYDTVKELSIRDGLTGLFVRRHFLERFEEELRRCLKYELPLAVLMLDIDHFKRYNDDFGHLAGDATLKQAAVLLKECLRRVDIVARYGGEEFVVVIPETKCEGAVEVAERIRSSIARHEFKVYQEQTKVTVSLGVALFPEDVPGRWDPAHPHDLAMELIRCSDRALYRAKEEGRNRVILFQDI